MGNYIKKFRAKIGHDKFIHPAARIIVENKNYEVLIIERIDNEKIGLPAGSLEENETIEECIKREVTEETGLRGCSLDVIGISSKPAIENVEYPNGDKIQYFTIEFYSNDWEGKIKVRDTKEIKNAKFVKWSELKPLPKNELSAMESFEYFKAKRKIMLK